MICEVHRDGIKLWENTSNFGDYEVLNSISIDPLGNIIAGGSYNNTNGENCMIVKYNSNGNLLWEYRCETVDGENINSITLDSSQNIHAVGTLNREKILLITLKKTVRSAQLKHIWKMV